jgi:hypothetical protein
MIDKLILAQRALQGLKTSRWTGRQRRQAYLASTTVRFSRGHTHLRQGDILTNAKLTEFVNVKVADRCKAKWFCHRPDEKKAGLFDTCFLGRFRHVSKAGA